MRWFKKKIKVVVHDGGFHADEVFACATLSLWAEKNGQSLDIARTRDSKIIEEADIVADVGFVYDSEKGRFDHHQKGGAGEHENGIPYASFGLVWKHYGEMVCGEKTIADMIENKLVIPIDAMDNGINTTQALRTDVPEYRIMKELVYAFRPTWQDSKEKADKNFMELMNIAKKILNGEIHLCSSVAVGEVRVKKEIEKQNEPEILILEEDLPWEQITSKTEKIKVVVYPEPDSNSWCVETVMNNLNDYESHRVQFPVGWQGLRDEELTSVSGVKNAVFCHRAGFFAVNKTKEGAIEMAQKALQNSAN